MFSVTGATAAQDCSWVEAMLDNRVPEGTWVSVCDAQPQVLCQWEFAYRAQEAQSAFEALHSDLEACLGRAGAQDAPVNHPDSYQLEEYAADGAGVFLSIKDKASLDRTFVFLRIAQR